MQTDAAISQWERDVCLKVRSIDRAFVLSFDSKKKQIEQLKNNYILLLTIGQL